MPSFSLTLEIETQDLKRIMDAGEQLVVVKAPGDGSGSQVAWVAFRPFQANAVRWAPDYALYARRQTGEVVAILTTEFPTPSGVAYKLGASGFQPTAESLYPPPGTYRAFNELDDDPTLEFGLVQEVDVNGTTGRERIDAQIIPVHQLADFTPDETVIVWLQSNVAVGDVVPIPPPVGATPLADTTTVKSRSTEIRFGGSVVEATYEYDSSVGGFVPSGQA